MVLSFFGDRGNRELLISLNSVDFGPTSLKYKYYRQLEDLTIEPTGGLVTGGTLVTFIGIGFDGLFGALNDTRHR